MTLWGHHQPTHQPTPECDSIMLVRIDVSPAKDAPQLVVAFKVKAADKLLASHICVPLFNTINATFNKTYEVLR